MLQRQTLSALGVMAGIGLWLWGVTFPALAEIKFSKQAELQANEKTVGEILAAFDRADAALKAQDLETLMALYSKDYNYHGLGKNDLREAWKDLFARYRRISTHHMFSKVVVRTEGTITKAHVTCTGGLWATSDSTGERVNIDSWFEEIHRLVYEDGIWRILGHDGEDQSSLLMGGVHPFF